MIKDDTKYDWKFCFNDGGNGHSLWLDRITNRYSIKDRSGSRPQFTDDGVLWVRNDSASVQISRDKLYVAFSVESERNGGRAGWCWCVLDFGIRVAKELNMEVVLSEELKKLKPLFALELLNSVS
jgi:hypothetical protein